jgi:hypothetical protein
VQCDNGREFDKSASRAFFLAKGVSLRLSCPYTSQQNGKAERMLRTLNNITGTLLVHVSVLSFIQSVVKNSKACFQFGVMDALQSCGILHITRIFIVMFLFSYLLLVIDQKRFIVVYLYYYKFSTFVIV